MFLTEKVIENIQVKTSEPISEIKINKSYHNWLIDSSNKIRPVGKLNVVDKIPSGLYIISEDNDGYFIRNEELIIDELYNLPYKESIEILDDITSFWEKESLFIEHKMVYKRGILLYGPAGSGKTSLLNLAILDLIYKQNGVVFKISKSYELEFYTRFIKPYFREIEPNRPIICIIEDIENFTDSSSETLLLNLLDGVDQTHKVVYVATTNYPEKLEDRILNRPSRFDKRYLIGAPETHIRKAFFENKFKGHQCNFDLDKWAEDSEGLMIAHLKELFIQVVIFDKTFDEAISSLKKMSEEKLSSNDFKPNKKSVGFRK